MKNVLSMTGSSRSTLQTQSGVGDIDNARSAEVREDDGGHGVLPVPPTPENREALQRKIASRFYEQEDIERFILAMDGSQDAIWDWNLDARTFYGAARLKKMLGYADTDLDDDPETWWLLWHPDFALQQSEAFASHFRGETDCLALETKLRCKDGTWLWVHLRGRAVRDSDGRVYRVAGTVSDISQRKTDEAARIDVERPAQSSDSRLSDAIGVLADGFALFDSDDRMVMHNSQLALAFGCDASSLKEGMAYRSVLEILCSNVVGMADEAISPDAGIETLTAYHVLPEGSIVIETAGDAWYRFTERKTEDGGTALVIGNITASKLTERDLTSQVEELQTAKVVSDEQRSQLAVLAERLAEAKEVADAASRTKSEFLANMSHELRTPLNAIMGFSEVIKNELFGPVGVPQYRQYSDDIYESGAHLLAIINDILDLSKVEAGKFDLNDTEIKVHDICRSVLHIVKGRADEAGIMLVKGLPESLPYLVADPRTLKQMLLNLLSDAIKFTPSGGTVDLVVTVRDDGSFRFDIRDTGIGIPKEHFKTVLSPFGQVDTAHARDHQGTGLGLPLVKAFIEMHDGSIEIESELGEGTTVSLFFPPERSRSH